MREIDVHPPLLLDPRPLVRSRSVPLAPRLPSLQGRRLLLFDNDCLRHWEGPHAVVYPTLAQRLQAQYGVVECRRMTVRLAGSASGTVPRLAAEIASGAADAVVIALCETATAAATLLLAWELERQGRPTVTVCHEAALYLAAAMTMTVLPGLPLSSLTLIRPPSDPEMVAEMLWVAGEVEEALISSPEQLHMQFRQTFMAASERLQANAAGELSLWNVQSYQVTESASIDLDPSTYAAELYEAFSDSGLCDGLPIIPPTRERVEAMLAWSARDAIEPIVPRCFPSGLPLTVGTLAINAVMAGCRPNSFPILLTAAEAVADPRYQLMQAGVASHPGGHAILVSGPLAEEAGLASEGGCLGPGFRANLTISRALNLSLANASHPLPQRTHLCTMGSAAQLAFCCAENVRASPWSAFHVDRFDAATTCVTVVKCESPPNVVDQLSTRAERLVHGIADVAATLGRHSAYVPADLVVLLNPAHARLIHADGWRKPDVQRFLFEHARNPRQWLTGRGIEPVRSAALADQALIPVVSSPEDVLVFVVGAYGPHTMVGLPWGYSRAVTKAVMRHDGQPARHLLECYRGD